MSHKGLPIPGYVAQSQARLDFVTENKHIEERLLRRIDAMQQAVREHGMDYDLRWVAIAKTHFEQGFMAMNRAVFQPKRVELPEDKPEQAN